MKAERLREDLVVLVGYLLTSAYGLYDEPANYGPFRLVDAAGRLLSAMEAAGLSDPFLMELRQGIEAQRFGRSDDEALRAFLDQACVRFAGKLKEQVSASPSGLQNQ
jgi:hypothetical protein